MYAALSLPAVHLDVARDVQDQGHGAGLPLLPRAHGRARGEAHRLKAWQPTATATTIININSKNRNV